MPYPENVDIFIRTDMRNVTNRNGYAGIYVRELRLLYQFVFEIVKRHGFSIAEIDTMHNITFAAAQ